MPINYRMITTNELWNPPAVGDFDEKSGMLGREGTGIPRLPCLTVNSFKCTSSDSSADQNYSRTTLIKQWKVSGTWQVHVSHTAVGHTTRAPVWASSELGDPMLWLALPLNISHSQRVTNPCPVLKTSGYRKVTSESSASPPGPSCLSVTS